jgi:DNA-nicking Smr family endonuclease
MAKRKKKPSKKNKYNNLSQPEATFDFHNRGPLRKDQIISLTNEFINECLERGLSKILFITGKGLHSAKGMPIIKPLIKHHLSNHPKVLRLYEGRRDRGGSGTVEVILEN